MHLVPHSRNRQVIDSPSPSAAPCGFTAFELLLIIAIAAILLFIFFPAFNRPRPTNGIQCLNNTRQLTLGWLMYATDNEDALIPNEPYVGATATPTNNWIGGVMDWSANPQNTNVAFLLTNRLGDYIRSALAFHCPADQSVSAAGPRVRSYAMNAFLSGSNRVTKAGWKQFANLSEIRKPGSMFVIVDEHANSIDDGYFLNDPNVTNAWQDLPAANHNGAAGFSFADGHSEIHKWVDRSTKQGVVPGGPKPAITLAPGNTAQDLAWVLERTTYRDTNTVTLP